MDGWMGGGDIGEEMGGGTEDRWLVNSLVYGV